MGTVSSYDILQDIYKHIFEQQKYAELKNGVMLTFLSGIFLAISLKLEIDSKSVVLFFLAINIAITLFSFYPNLSSFTFSNQKEKDPNSNIYFFESIKYYTKLDYLELVLKENKDEISKSNKILVDMSNQIVILSKIISNKYLIYKVSYIYFCIYSVITLAIYFIGK